jgi:CBS domain containing-hemolysin-like protein
VLNIITGFIIKLLGGNQEHGPSLTEEELKTIVTVGHEEGVLEKEEKEMIHNVFEFGETEIKEIMTPLSIIAFSISLIAFLSQGRIAIVRASGVVTVATWFRGTILP